MPTHFSPDKLFKYYTLEKKNTILPHGEHEWGDNGWACFWDLCMDSLSSLLHDITHQGPWVCECWELQKKHVEVYPLKRQLWFCYRSSVILLLHNLNRFSVSLPGQRLNPSTHLDLLCGVRGAGQPACVCVCFPTGYYLHHQACWCQRKVKLSTREAKHLYYFSFSQQPTIMKYRLVVTAEIVKPHISHYHTVF